MTTNHTPARHVPMRYSDQLKRDLEAVQDAFKAQPTGAGEVPFRQLTIVRRDGEYHIKELAGDVRDVPLPDLTAAVIAVRNYARSAKGGWPADVYELRTNAPNFPILFMSRSAVPQVGQLVNQLEDERAHPDANHRRTGLFYRVKAIDLNAFSIDLERVDDVGVLFEGGWRWSSELEL